jgi:hypothetical protein
MAKMGGEQPPVEYASWDFSQGRRFEEEILDHRGSSVHHPSSSPIGSFLLLAVFTILPFASRKNLLGWLLALFWVVLRVVFIFVARSLAIFDSQWPLKL